MLTTLANFRELGGYKGKDGFSVKRGVIFRSGEINTLSEEDQKAFQDDYQIQQIFDLRSDEEVAQRPNQTFEKVQSTHIDIMKGAKSNASLDEMESHFFQADAYMQSIYREFIESKAARLGYQQFLVDVSELETPFIFHCFAGKDRTGFGAALLMSILGVSKKDIYHDYLLTNELRKKPNAQLLEMMSQKGASQEQLATMNTMMTVKPAYLDVSFSEIEKNYGDMQGYLKDGLALDKVTIDVIQNKYLA